MDEQIFTAGQEGYYRLLENIGTWIGDHGFQILLIIAAAIIVKKFGVQITMQLVRKTVRKDLYPTKADREKRLKTLEGLISAILKVSVIAIAIVMVLSEVGLNTTPIIASAGILGVALGFGAQSLVKDLTSGLFIIIENQYRVGDVVELDNGIIGQVEAITIRTTMLRTLDGTLYHVPNGTIGWTANKTTSYGGIDEEIVVAMDSDIEKVALIINRTGQKLAKNPKYHKMIKEPPHFLRVDGYAPNGLRIKIIGKTGSDDAWDIKGVFYKELINEFRRAGIEVPFNQIALHQAVDKSTPKKSVRK